MIDKMNRIIEDKEWEERKESIVIKGIKTREKIGAEWVQDFLNKKKEELWLKMSDKVGSM